MPADIIPITNARKVRNAVDRLREKLETHWHIVEPHFVEEFEGLMIRKIAFGIEPTPEDYEHACAEVMKRSGLFSE